MAKTSLVLFTSKTLKNGEHPIMLRTFDNGKYKHQSLGVSCTKANWNVKQCKVSSKDKDYIKKNAVISQYLNSINKIDEDIAVSKTKTIGMIVEEYANSCKTLMTKEKYLRFKRRLEEFADEPISKMNTEMLVKLLERYDNEYTKKDLIVYFKATFNYAKSMDLVRGKINYSIPVIVPKGDRNLSISEISIILNYYKKALFALKDDYAMKNGALHQGMSFFMLSYFAQGIAPVDLCLLKKEDIHIKKINSIDFDAERMMNEEGYLDWYKQNNKVTEIVTFKFTRKKTHKTVVDVVMDYQTVKPLIDLFSRLSEGSPYLINCFEEGMSEKDRVNKLCGYVRWRIGVFHKEIEAYSKGLNLPVVPYFSAYSARKAFINKVLSLNLPVATVQKLIGHKTILFDHYARPLTELEQAEVTKQLLGKFEFN